MHTHTLSHTRRKRGIERMREKEREGEHGRSRESEGELKAGGERKKLIDR